MEGQGITGDDAVALASIKNANRALGRVAEEANRNVEARLGQAVESSKWRLDADEIYFARFSWEHETWLPLEFTFRPDDGLPEPTGALVFMAGVTYPLGRDPFADAHVENTLSEDFTDFKSPDHKGRIMRTLSPDALLAESSQSGQARVLSDWILESFDMIEACFG